MTMIEIKSVRVVSYMLRACFIVVTLLFQVYGSEFRSFLLISPTSQIIPAILVFVFNALNRSLMDSMCSPWMWLNMLDYSFSISFLDSLMSKFPLNFTMSASQRSLVVAHSFTLSIIFLYKHIIKYPNAFENEWTKRFFNFNNYLDLTLGR